ncbi:MAG TPA: polymer-forming cytoskeletal protein [Thermoanaerobaculia bacterium]|nr:polymer-forming cytoskeletal protein [Thermoanaerobaculia bacterium]
MKALLPLLLLALAIPAQAAPRVPARTEPALRLEAGSTTGQQLVAIDRDVSVEGEALADVAALDGSVDVSGKVDGNIIVLRGDARLAPTARVAGDVFVIGGTIRAAHGAQTGGRMVSYPNAPNAWLTLLEGPSIGLGFASRLVLGAKLALVASWAALLLLFFAASGRQLIETAEGVRREPFRSFFVGLTGVICLVLTALFFTAFARGLLGAPFVVLVVLLGLVLKLWGTVAVFYALGEWLSRHVFRRRFQPLNAATIGLLVLGAIKFLPWFGVLSWYVVSFIGVGATLSTKFGRREPWFELA